MNRYAKIAILALLIAACYTPVCAFALNVVNLSEKRCYLESDLGNAFANGKCWIIVDGDIYDLSNDIFWAGKHYEGYKCGGELTSSDLVKKGITLRHLLDYYGDMAQVSRIGRICDTRTVVKPAGCDDKTCDVTKENFVNCPQDCSPSVQDGWCVPFDDFICDPDCGRTQDPNCVCNMNGYCDKPFENHDNCPMDCPPEQKDGFCFKRADGICDPDCQPGTDPDCGPAPAQTTITSSTVIRVSTTSSGFCGDGICGPDENYLNCRTDCPSGSKDGYCDGVKDGVCDPDCHEGDDPDCILASATSVPPTSQPSGPKNDPLDYLIYLVPAVLILFVAYIAYRRMKNMRE